MTIYKSGGFIFEYYDTTINLLKIDQQQSSYTIQGSYTIDAKQYTLGTINSKCFQQIQNLFSLDISTVSSTIIGTSLQSNTNLQQVFIQSKLQQQTQIFQNCTNLQTIIISGTDAPMITSLQGINSRKCINIVNIDSINISLFGIDTSYCEYKIISGTQNLILASFNINKQCTLYIPDSITQGTTIYKITSLAIIFQNNTYIKSVNMIENTSITSLSDNMFSGCSSIQTFYFNIILTTFALSCLNTQYTGITEFICNNIGKETTLQDYTLQIPNQKSICYQTVYTNPNNKDGSPTIADIKTFLSQGVGIYKVNILDGTSFIVPNFTQENYQVTQTVTFLSNTSMFNKYNDNYYLQTVDFSQNTSIKQICDYCFYYQQSLITIILNNNINYLGQSSFFNCVLLQQIILNQNTSVKYQTFYNCLQLQTNVENITNLDDYSFFNCNQLNNIILNVSSIPNYCFTKCSALANIYFKTIPASIGTNAFGTNSKAARITLYMNNYTTDLSSFKTALQASMSAGRSITYYFQYYKDSITYLLNKDNTTAGIIGTLNGVVLVPLNINYNGIDFKINQIFEGNYLCELLYLQDTDYTIQLNALDNIKSIYLQNSTVYTFTQTKVYYSDQTITFTSDNKELIQTDKTYENINFNIPYGKFYLIKQLNKVINCNINNLCNSDDLIQLGTDYIYQVENNTYKSLQFPLDILTYSSGIVTSRTDTLNNISLNFDFRNTDLQLYQTLYNSNTYNFYCYGTPQTINSSTFVIQDGQFSNLQAFQVSDVNITFTGAIGFNDQISNINITNGNNIFLNNQCQNITLGDQCKNIMFGNQCGSWEGNITIQEQCENIQFGNQCAYRNATISIGIQCGQLNGKLLFGNQCSYSSAEIIITQICAYQNSILQLGNSCCRYDSKMYIGNNCAYIYSELYIGNNCCSYTSNMTIQTQAVQQQGRAYIGNNVCKFNSELIIGRQSAIQGQIQIGDNCCQINSILNLGIGSASDYLYSLSQYYTPQLYNQLISQQTDISQIYIGDNTCQDNSELAIGDYCAMFGGSIIINRFQNQLPSPDFPSIKSYVCNQNSKLIIDDYCAITDQGNINLFNNSILYGSENTIGTQSVLKDARSNFNNSSLHIESMSASFNISEYKTGTEIVSGQINIGNNILNITNCKNIYFDVLQIGYDNSNNSSIDLCGGMYGQLTEIGNEYLHLDKINFLNDTTQNYINIQLGNCNQRSGKIIIKKQYNFEIYNNKLQLGGSQIQFTGDDIQQLPVNVNIYQGYHNERAELFIGEQCYNMIFNKKNIQFKNYIQNFGQPTIKNQNLSGIYIGFSSYGNDQKFYGINKCLLGYDTQQQIIQTIDTDQFFPDAGGSIITYGGSGYYGKIIQQIQAQLTSGDLCFYKSTYQSNQIGIISVGNRCCQMNSSINIGIGSIVTLQDDCCYYNSEINIGNSNTLTLGMSCCQNNSSINIGNGSTATISDFSCLNNSSINIGNNCGKNIGNILIGTVGSIINNCCCDSSKIIIGNNCAQNGELLYELDNTNGIKYAKGTIYLQQGSCGQNSILEIQDNCAQTGNITIGTDSIYSRSKCIIGYNVCSVQQIGSVLFDGGQLFIQSGSCKNNSEINVGNFCLSGNSSNDTNIRIYSTNLQIQGTLQENSKLNILNSCLVGKSDLIIQNILQNQTINIENNNCYTVDPNTGSMYQKFNLIINSIKNGILNIKQNFIQSTTKNYPLGLTIQNILDNTILTCVGNLQCVSGTILTQDQATSSQYLYIMDIEADNSVISSTTTFTLSNKYKYIQGNFATNGSFSQYYILQQQIP